MCLSGRLVGVLPPPSARKRPATQKPAKRASDAHAHRKSSRRFPYSESSPNCSAVCLQRPKAKSPPAIEPEATASAAGTKRKPAKPAVVPGAGGGGGGRVKRVKKAEADDDDDWVPGQQGGSDNDDEPVGRRRVAAVKQEVPIKQEPADGPPPQQGRPPKAPQAPKTYRYGPITHGLLTDPTEVLLTHQQRVI